MAGNIKTGDKDAIAPSQEQMDFLKLVMGGVVITLFLGFISLIFALYGIYGQYTAFKDETTKQLQQSVDKLNSSIKLLIPTNTPTPTP